MPVTAESDSNQKRWDEAVEEAGKAIQILIDIQAEYQDQWTDLTEKQQESTKGRALDVVCNICLQEAMDIIAECQDIEIP